MIGRPRDSLLEVARPRGRDLGPPNRPVSDRPKRTWRSLLGQSHLLILPIAAGGWAYSAFLWPTWLLPAGIAVGAPHRDTGLLDIDADGRIARFVGSDQLTSDWRAWAEDDATPRRGECLALPLPIEHRLAATFAADTGSPRPHQYWVTLDLAARFGPDQCGANDRLHDLQGISRIDAITPVPCSRGVFIANGFTCPSIGTPTPSGVAVPAPSDGSDFYPAAAIRAGDEGRVTVRIDRDATGSPIHCAVLRSSGHAALDRRTCKLVGTDPSFTPRAADAVGSTAPIVQSVVWKIPG